MGITGRTDRHCGESALRRMEAVLPGLKPVTARIKVEEENTKPISEHLIGVFFEDLNYAADGGLYAELIQNREL